MKKIISILLAVAVSVGAMSALAACKPSNRDEILKIYMPGNYIDEDIFEEFSAWYEEQTGKKVTVDLKPFEAVEDVQLAVEGSKADYDLLCPSDYMVEYLIKNNLVQKLDKNIIDITANGLFKSEYIDTTKEFDPTLEYSVPYMYGTLGLVYDYSKTGKHITSWSSFFGEEFTGKGQLSLKQSIRDAYAAACIYNANVTDKTGAAQKSAIQAVFEDTSADTIAAAKNALLNVKKNAVWDVDNVKFEMAQNAAGCNVAVALMWSCDAGYVMNDYEDDDGNEHAGNRNLWYVVPEEGGNVYIDAFVISKYAKNVQAANYFLKFLCTKDIAIANSEWAGAISPVAAAYDELYDYYIEDEDGMFDDTPEGWKEMFIETMFPSTETLNRCGVMKDFGDGKNAVVDMWASIR